MHADFNLNRDLAAVQCRFFERLLILLAFLFLAVWATSAYANFGMIFEWRGGDGSKNVLRLLDKPCESKKILDFIQDAYHKQFRAAQLTYQGKQYASCWMASGGSVHSIDEAGDLLPPIRMDAFREDPGV